MPPVRPPTADPVYGPPPPGGGAPSPRRSTPRLPGRAVHPVDAGSGVRRPRPAPAGAGRPARVSPVQRWTAAGRRRPPLPAPGWARRPPPAPRRSPAVVGHPAPRPPPPTAGPPGRTIRADARPGRRRRGAPATPVARYASGRAEPPTAAPERTTDCPGYGCAAAGPRRARTRATRATSRAPAPDRLPVRPPARSFRSGPRPTDAVLPEADPGPPTAPSTPSSPGRTPACATRTAKPAASPDRPSARRPQRVRLDAFRQAR